MERIAQPSETQIMPHIVQLYQPSVSTSKLHESQIIHITHAALQTTQCNVTYQQSISSETISIPLASHVNVQDQIQTTENQIVMTEMQNIHPPLQAQVLQSTDINQPLQITSHVVFPPVYKQHVLVNGIPQYYGQYETYQKDLQCTETKIKSEAPLLNEKEIEECKSENWNADEDTSPQKKKKNRSQLPNPDQWACNVRKIKHQRGEAYINKRGKYVPEKSMRTTKDCLKHCKYKCNQIISNADRELIFKAFYSLNGNEKRHFLLNTTERNCVKTSYANRRKYSFKYFFLVRAVRYIVCKDFYLGTLAISQKPIYNVHASKSDVNIPKPDGRGLAVSSTLGISSNVKDRVRNHILSFQTIDCKPINQFSKKKQYLDPSYSIRQMYVMYVKECTKDHFTPVKESMYRKIFKNEFNIQFKKMEKFCCRCKEPIKKKS